MAKSLAIGVISVNKRVGKKEEKTKAPDERTPEVTRPKAKFNAGDIVIHKLSKEKLVVTESYFEIHRNCHVYTARRSDYMLIDVNEFELLDSKEKKKKASKKQS